MHSTGTFSSCFPTPKTTHIIMAAAASRVVAKQHVRRALGVAGSVRRRLLATSAENAAAVSKAEEYYMHLEVRPGRTAGVGGCLLL